MTRTNPTPTDPSARLLKFLQASPEQVAIIDQILDGGDPIQFQQAADGPLLLPPSTAHRYLGVSRTTLWRMIQQGTLTPVEPLPGMRMLRRSDLDALAKGE